MNYSRLATVSELKEKLTEIKPDSKIEKSGIPMLSENDSLYIKDDEAHSMIIGSLGSGKTQTTVLPLLRLAIKAEESLIVNDTNGEIYDTLKDELTKKDYNVATINLLDYKKSNHFNPLELPYKLYRNNNKDQAIDMLESISNYIFSSDRYNDNTDPFWTNSATSLFIGLTLYEFENSKNVVTLNSVAELANDFGKIEEYMKSISKSTQIYMFLSSIVLAPVETKSSILSVFGQGIKYFVTRETLKEITTDTNFDIENIQKKKTALFIINDNKPYAARFIPMIIEECYQSSIITNDNKRRLNILIDEFETLISIKNFPNMLTLSRSHNIKFNIYIRSFLELENTYGKETTELLKFAFSNIIYLLSNDINTLEEISRMCGNQKTESGVEPLITPEELKLLDKFEAIVLIPRINPIRTKLVPDYTIEWR